MFCAGGPEDDGEAAALEREVGAILMQSNAAIKHKMDSAAKNPSFTCLLTQRLGVLRENKSEKRQSVQEALRMMKMQLPWRGRLRSSELRMTLRSQTEWTEQPGIAQRGQP